MRACTEIKQTLAGATKIYHCELLSLRDGVGILRYVIDQEYDIAGFRLAPGDVTLAIYWETRPYTLYVWSRSAQKDRAHYFNIADSVSLRPETFFWRDLAVDVLIDPAGSVHVMDEHELPPDLPQELLHFIHAAKDHVRHSYRNIIQEADTLIAQEQGPGAGRRLPEGGKPGLAHPTKYAPVISTSPERS